MQDKSCYMPESEEEKQDILEQGHIITCRGVCGFNDNNTYLGNTSFVFDSESRNR